MKTNKDTVIETAIPGILRRVPSLRARDVPPLRDALNEVADALAGTGAPVVAPLTNEEIALIRDSFRAKVTSETPNLPGV